jgi:integrase
MERLLNRLARERYIILGEGGQWTQAVSFAWPKVKQIVGEVYKLDADDVLKERYAKLLILAAARGLHSAELFALRLNDLDFKAGTIRLDESADQRTYIYWAVRKRSGRSDGSPCDAEGREALSYNGTIEASPC